MKVFRLMAALMASLSSTFAHFPSRKATASAVNGTSIAKRWHSVDDRVGMSLPAPYNFAWPITCSSPKKVQPIRYCYRNARSAKNLKPILEEAIKIWAPAMAVSAMTIMPDPACDDHDECICTQHGASPDSLVLSDETIDGDLQHNQSEECATETTVGYDYIPRGEPDRPWRHYLRFGEWDPHDPEKTWAFAVRALAHELGHAMGLLHEHQRRDRDQFLKFRPDNLMGYGQLKKDVVEDTKQLFPDTMSQRTRLWKVFDEARYAMSYFPTMLDFLRGDQFKHTEEEDRAEAAKSSVDFDYDSIMIYDCWMGGWGGPDDRKDWVFSRRDNGEGVWCGGSKDGIDARITEGDIARIAQLYDNGTPECQAAQRGEHGWGTGIRVKIRDGEWAHVDPPNRSNFTKRDEL